MARSKHRRYGEWDNTPKKELMKELICRLWKKCYNSAPNYSYQVQCYRQLVSVYCMYTSSCHVPKFEAYIFSNTCTDISLEGLWIYITPISRGHLIIKAHAWIHNYILDYVHCAQFTFLLRVLCQLHGVSWRRGFCYFCWDYGLIA